MSETLMSLPYSKLYNQVDSFYSMKQLDHSYQILLKLISKIPNFPNEESIPFNNDREIVWVRNHQLEEFLDSLQKKQSIPQKLHSMLQQGIQSAISTVISQLLITKIRIYVYKNDKIDLLDKLHSMENEINIFGSRIISILETVQEVEDRIKHYLKNTPVINEFESLYHSAIQARQDGNLVKAKSIAAELGVRKNKYMLATKVVQNDCTVLQQYYSNIHMIHKSIVSTDRTLMEQKDHFMTDRIQSLNRSYSEEMNALKRKQVLDVLGGQIEMVTAELSNLKQRGEVILIKENQINQTLKQLQGDNTSNVESVITDTALDDQTVWVSVKSLKENHV